MAKCALNYDKTIDNNKKLQKLFKTFETLCEQNSFVQQNVFRDVRKVDNDEFDGSLSKLNDSIIEKSFPPCMKRMVKNLIEDCHLKYEARIQLGLFLKGIGFTLDESMQFFKNIFLKKISIDKVIICLV